jgi:ribosomal-protein-alanine N-acetyltransferase
MATRAPRIETPRLILREWTAADREPFARLNADGRVMEHFPSVLTTEESDAMADRIEANLERRGFGLFAAELRTTGRFIGFIGLSVPRFEAYFTPCVEIGWRIAFDCWGQGWPRRGRERFSGMASTSWSWARLFPSRLRRTCARGASWSVSG